MEDGVGALTIVNSSMTSASAFANLDSVGSNGQLAAFKSSSYEIVVSGMADGLV